MDDISKLYAPVTIRRVSNGYMVTPVADIRQGLMHADSDVLVFETLRAVQDFLDRHFNPK